MQLRKITAFRSKSAEKLVDEKKRRGTEGGGNTDTRNGCASTLAEPPLSLPVPCGPMPRTWASPRPSCPMVQLIICSATRKLMLSYASLRSVTAGCQGQSDSELGGGGGAEGARQTGLASEALAGMRWDEWTPQNLSS